MKRPVRSAPFHSRPGRGPRGYTLVEILVATALTLVMMVTVVRIFGEIGESVSDSRATLEVSDRLRVTATLLERDLSGITVLALPPRRPEAAPGYTEIIEGPVGPVVAPHTIARDSSNGYAADTTVGDVDDILMFTTHSLDRPFAGRYAGSTIESDTAEIAWFLRGRTLYRRVLLVAPGAAVPPAPQGFYRDLDISVHFDGSRLVANTLSDLTKRECRYAHRTDQFPFDVRDWGPLRLPTLCECSHPNWRAGDMAPIAVTNPDPQGRIDFWLDPHPWPEVDPQIGSLRLYCDSSDPGQRIGEDIVLTDVIGFDVKVWDPGLGAYVDLGGGPNASPVPVSFLGDGHPRSGLASSSVRVYDTWSFHYEQDGINQNGNALVDEGTDGFDNDGTGGVDDVGERETAPPYAVPLRGIQVKIRVFEPDSRQIREVTVVQDFLPK